MLYNALTQFAVVVVGVVVVVILVATVVIIFCGWLSLFCFVVSCSENNGCS